MTHKKCSQCGLNNWHGDEVCERCGVSLITASLNPSRLRRQQEEARFKRFQHVQRPRDRDIIVDLATGQRLSFQ